MSIKEHITEIKSHLIKTTAEILPWFEKEERIKNYRPLDGGWTIQEILEHISLTNYFLLILIEKGSKKSLKNVQGKDLKEELANYHFSLEKLSEVGILHSFEWIRPVHMEPKGEMTNLEIKIKLIDQLGSCLNFLDVLNKGEGLLYTTTMTVNDLGKLNVYEYIYFLSKHAERHISQMTENESELE